MNGNGRNVRRLTWSASAASGVAGTRRSTSPRRRGRREATGSRSTGGHGRGSPCPRLCANWRVLVVGVERRWAEGDCAHFRAPAWSPGGRRVAFMSDMDPEELARTVTIAGADGTRGLLKSRRLTATSALSGRRPAARSPSRPTAQRSLDPGSTSSAPTAPAGAGWRPAATRPWSPDGPPARLHRQLQQADHDDEDGIRKRRVSRVGESVVAAPAWSPKGDTLALPVRKAEPLRRGTE